jgi:hypothetical protein
VAIHCTNCGIELPVERACFCSNCGVPLASDASSSAGSQEHSRTVLHEQMALRPPTFQVRNGRDEPPAWLGNPGSKSMSDHVLLPAMPLLTHAPIAVPEESVQVQELETMLLPAQGPEHSEDRQELRAEVEQLDTVRLASYPSIASAQEVHPPFSSEPSPQQRSSRPRSNRPLYVGVILLVVLLLGGAIAWAVALQPFSVPAVTVTQQRFRDARFGFMLLYPNGWRVQTDTKTATVRFTDSTRTAQVNVTVTDAAGLGAALYLRKLATQRGMTNVKTAPPLTFAGASWLQLQGNVLQQGASYNEVLLTTVHGAHFYTLMQLAPQSIYGQEEQLVFSSIRSSMQFLS